MTLPYLHTCEPEFASIGRKPSKVLMPDKEKRESAASTIQQSWRRRQATAKQERYQKENEDAIVGIQSALKAHLVRKRTISLRSGSISPTAVNPSPGSDDLADGCSDSSDAIELIQSVARGYFTRQMALQDLRQSRYVCMNLVLELQCTNGRGLMLSTLSWNNPPPSPKKVNSIPLVWFLLLCRC